MSPSLFCCPALQPFKPRRTDHEPKFAAFMAWGRDAGDGEGADLDAAPYVIQLVRQINYGPIESKRYFAKNKNDNDNSDADADAGAFAEVGEDALVAANYTKLNSYKNYRCTTHDRFFEVNVYKKDPVNKHHWRADLAWPATDIDL